MSYMLTHLHNGWDVDQAILTETHRVVVIRFGYIPRFFLFRVKRAALRFSELSRHRHVIGSSAEIGIGMTGTLSA
jgi:hypothetical protein